MNSYLLRRLAPFFVFSVLVEFGFMALQLYQNAANVDFSFLTMVKTGGVLLLTTSVSFLFVMQPYVFYLLILPRRRQNSRLDKIITTTAFFVFAFSTLCEEAASQIFWEEFASSFNFIVVDYIIFTHQVLSNLEHAYPVIKILLGILTAAVVFTLLAYRWLFTAIEAPKFNRRLFQSVIYGLVCILAYLNINVAQIEIAPDSYNNEIAKEGTYSLFSSLHKNEIDYDKFYLTQPREKNLEILQNIFAGKNVTFTEPKKDITRQINSFRPEKRANVIIVIMRGISAAYLEKSHAGYMPNLQKLAEQSLYFPNAYATGRNSARAIEAIDFSLPPLPGLPILSLPGGKNLHGLGGIFKSKGYDNKWIYGSYGMLDRMDGFLADGDFKIMDRSRWRKGEITYADLLSVSDEDLYRKTIAEADKSAAADKPFFSLLMTSSNRYPYAVPDTFADFPANATRRQKAVRYADYALGRFIEEARSKPWFDNTVFVFVSDRAVKKNRTAEVSPESYRIPLLVYGPKFVRPQTVRTPVSQIDVAPTLLGLLDFSYESRFYGSDALSPGYTPRIFYSRWQKIDCQSRGVAISLSPGKGYAVTPAKTRKSIAEKHLAETIAFYQQASEKSQTQENEQ